MNSEIDQIRTVIAEILVKFKGVTVRYEYKESSKSHLIEVTPLEVFRTTDFRAFAKSKVFEFYNMFRQTNFTFISEESLARISTPEIVESNKDYWLSPFTLSPAVEGYFMMASLKMSDLLTTIKMAGHYTVPSLDLSSGIIRVVGDTGETENTWSLVGNPAPLIFNYSLQSPPEFHVTQVSEPSESFWGLVGSFTTLGGWRKKKQTEPRKPICALAA